MWKKVVLFFINISLIFNSGLNKIVIFANIVDKNEENLDIEENKENINKKERARWSLNKFKQIYDI